MILEIRDASGKIDLEGAHSRQATQAVSPQAAYQVTNILAGNTDPQPEPDLGGELEIRNGPRGTHRPIAVKTGTANEARDLATYGYLAPAEGPKPRPPSRSASGWATATTRTRRRRSRRSRSRRPLRCGGPSSGT